MSGLPYQVVGTGGNNGGVPALYRNGQFRSRLKTALQINIQRQTQAVKARPQICARCGYTKYAEAQEVILTRTVVRMLNFR